MDWFSWLSKTTLNPTLVYEYGLAFTRNELVQADIRHFSHEFLQSMGVSIAKHRLEILKLAHKENKDLLLYNNSKPSTPPPTISKLVSVIKNTSNTFVKYVRAISVCDDSALVVLPRPSRSCSSRKLRSAVLRKSQKLSSKQGRLLLTNGSATPMVVSTPKLQSFSSPLVYAVGGEDEKIGSSHRYWSGRVDEMRWDSMFQDLRPT